ncbi:hypothetical protein SAMN05216252_14141 [Actinacidiphila glaucinigra]|uniref:NACHT domain-containing protein n=2 Tax=Actinacidiphila glaucinigra TaxID=235986 RepID=A0A239NN62_9ACTN|nr:hypothetical protein SAMN05216252_14141 [Actinacidiphila glaucinigra]
MRSDAGRAIIGGMRVEGRRHRRVWQAVGWVGGAVVVVLVLITWRQLSRGDFEPQDAASLWGPPLGIAGLLVAVLALRKPSEGNTADLVRTWAATLAALVVSGEGRIYNQLLGDDTVPIDLAYTLQAVPGRAATAPLHGRLLSTPTPASSLVLPPSHPAGGTPDVAAYWRQVQPQRLVVTGPAGAGKTVFALALILALLKDRTDTDPVPVRVPVSLWDSTTPLEAFLTQRLIEAYGWPKAQAAALVEHGMVLPVLDGLDEMDPTLFDGNPDPDAPRARAVLEKLDGYRVRGEPGPLVLTCRTAHLQALTARGPLRDSVQVTLAPVSPAHAVRYLTTRAQDRTRWQPLIDHLNAHPGGELATLLSTPWRLCLTATVYHDDGNPDELTTHATAQDLDQHLLARFIPATTRLHRHPRTRLGWQRTYRPEQVHRWLHHLTRSLTHTARFTGTSVLISVRTDLVLHELWPLAGRTRVRIVEVTLTASAMVLVAFLAWATFFRSAPVEVIFPPAVLAVTYLAREGDTSPGRLGFSRPAIPGSVLATALFGALLGAVVFGVGGGLMFGLARGLMLGLLGGFVFALSHVLFMGSVAPPAKEARPWALLRDDLVLKLVVGLALGLMFGLLFGLMFGLLAGLVGGPVIGLTMLPGVGVGSLLMRRYTAFLLCSTGHLPFRLVVFLDWASEAGLLRYAGPAYQFRHRELQQWLTSHPEPMTAPRTTDTDPRPGQRCVPGR